MRGLARRLGPEDLDHPAPGQAADPEGEIEREGTGGDDLHQHRPLLAHPHDGPLAELLVDLAEGHLEGLVPLHCHVVRSLRRPALRLEGTGSHGPECSGGNPTEGGVTGLALERQQRNFERLFVQVPSAEVLVRRARLPTRRRGRRRRRSSAGSSGCIVQVDGGPERRRERVEDDRHHAPRWRRPRSSAAPSGCRGTTARSPT